MRFKGLRDVGVQLISLGHVSLTTDSSSQFIDRTESEYGDIVYCCIVGGLAKVRVCNFFCHY